MNNQYELKEGVAVNGVAQTVIQRSEDGSRVTYLVKLEKVLGYRDMVENYVLVHLDGLFSPRYTVSGLGGYSMFEFDNLNSVEVYLGTDYALELK